MCRSRSGRSVAAALTTAVMLGCSASSQSLPGVVAFDSARAEQHLRDLVAIGPRVAGTPANAATRQYIIKSLAGFGVEAIEQPFEAETPIGLVKMANVVATVGGQRSERIVIASHFDTKLFRQFRFVGANDGGSSTAALLELGRVLKARRGTFTIELLFLDGEEAFVQWAGTDHTYGSRHYVTAARKAGTLGGVKALVLLDMIGDRDLNIRREENSTRWLTEIIWSTARQLGHERHFVDEVVPIEDDHLEFLAAGVPAVDLIDLEYHAWHTARDTLENVSARSIGIVGEVVVAALPEIEARLSRN